MEMELGCAVHPCYVCAILLWCVLAFGAMGKLCLHTQHNPVLNTYRLYKFCAHAALQRIKFEQHCSGFVCKLESYVVFLEFCRSNVWRARLRLLHQNNNITHAHNDNTWIKSWCYIALRAVQNYDCNYVCTLYRARVLYTELTYT